MNATAREAGSRIHSVVPPGCIEFASIGWGCIVSAIGRVSRKLVPSRRTTSTTPPWGRPVAFNPPRSFGDVAKSGIEAIEAALAAGLCLLVSVRRVSGQRYSAFESGDLRVLAPLDVHKYAFGCESCADSLG